MPLLKKIYILKQTLLEKIGLKKTVFPKKVVIESEIGNKIIAQSILDEDNKIELSLSNFMKNYQVSKQYHF